MDKKDEMLLKAEGWELECESPFEIRHEDGSFASGQAAQIVLSVLREEIQTMTFNEMAYGARFSYINDPETVWIKLGDEGYGTIARYDEKYIKHKNWTGQQICSFGDNTDELETLEVILREG